MNSGRATSPTIAATVGFAAKWHCLYPSDCTQVEALLSAFSEHLEELQASATWPQSVHIDVEMACGYVREKLSVATSAGGDLYAWWAELAQDGGVPVLLMATAVFSLSSVSSYGDRDQNLSALSALVETAQAENAAGHEYGLTLMEVDGGTAMRICRPTAPTDATGGRGRDQVIVQYALPVDEMPLMAILTFATPSVGHVAQLEPMFDAVARTMSVIPHNPAGDQHTSG